MPTTGTSLKLIVGQKKKQIETTDALVAGKVVSVIADLEISSRKKKAASFLWHKKILVLPREIKAETPKNEFPEQT